MADAIWNNNYILSNDRPDTMYTSGLEYDANDKISGYAGSAFAGGSEIPAEVSGLWQDASETVTANSGVWGSSALPISAGQGIAMSLSDNKLVVSAIPSAFYTLSISNIVLTASLPGSPDANTLYLIQE